MYVCVCVCVYMYIYNDFQVNVLEVMLFLNKLNVICLHTVESLKVLIVNTNNSILYQSCINRISFVSDIVISEQLTLSHNL